MNIKLIARTFIPSGLCDIPIKDNFGMLHIHPIQLIMMKPLPIEPHHQWHLFHGQAKIQGHQIKHATNPGLHFSLTTEAS